MYPHTKFEIIDNSAITPIQTSQEYKPLFMCTFTSDKGPETFQILDSDLSRIYGEISFARHGQPLLQADAIINAGGQILAKRVVASDAKLANIIIVAKTKKETIQKTNSTGQPLYLDNGIEVTTPTETSEPIMIDALRIKYEAHSVVDASSENAIHLAVKTYPATDENGFSSFPLFSIFDNGRGVSNKKFRISPDYDNSKTINFLRYKIEIIENNKLLESLAFSLDPDLLYLGNAFSLDTVVNKSSLQLRAKMYDDNMRAFQKLVEEVTGIENILLEDMISGKYRTSGKIQGIIIDPESVNLTSSLGISLLNGSNGSFGDSPIDSPLYEDELEKVYNGEFNEDIYDHLKYPIEVIIDANYPEKVKRAIEALVTFREDIFFFGDMGTSASSIEQFKSLMYEGAMNKFCAYSGLYYDIIDPYSKKQITVTYGHGLAKILPDHLKYGRNRPLAGIIHSAIIEDAIEGTVNFTPKVTPKVNQKQEMDDIRVNYASWIDGRLVLETQYTSQKEYTQLSFINNVLSIQEIIRAVRNRCPITRYSFIDGDDLENYKRDVQTVLNRYSNNFRQLEFEYIQDDIMVQNKIFYAAIKVTFRNYVQAEHFKIYAIG